VSNRSLYIIAQTFSCELRETFLDYLLGTLYRSVIYLYIINAWSILFIRSNPCRWQSVGESLEVTRSTGSIFSCREKWVEGIVWMRRWKQTNLRRPELLSDVVRGRRCCSSLVLSAHFTVIYLMSTCDFKLIKTSVS